MSRPGRQDKRLTCCPRLRSLGRPPQLATLRGGDAPGPPPPSPPPQHCSSPHLELKGGVGGRQVLPGTLLAVLRCSRLSRPGRSPLLTQPSQGASVGASRTPSGSTLPNPDKPSLLSSEDPPATSARVSVVVVGPC